MKKFDKSEINRPETAREFPIERLLTDQDREVLKMGLERLKAELDAMDPKDLPSTLIFIDSSARPLVSLVRPVIKQIYGSKKAPLPSFRFLNVDARSGGENYTQIFTQGSEESVREHLEWGVQFWGEEMKDLKASDQERDDSQSLYNDYRQKLDRFDSDIENTKESFAFVQERIQEIVAEMSTAGARLLFVDDFVADGDTLDYLRSAIRDLGKASGHEIDWKFFAFFRTYSHRDMTAPPSKDPKVIIGVNDYDNPEIKGYRGLLYRSNEESQEDTETKKEGVTGVTISKPRGKYAKKSPYVNMRMMKSLRDELRAMGEQAIKE